MEGCKDCETIKDIVIAWYKLEGVPNNQGAIIRFAEDRFSEIRKLLKIKME